MKEKQEKVPHLEIFKVVFNDDIEEELFALALTSKVSKENNKPFFPFPRKKEQKEEVKMRQSKFLTLPFLKTLQEKRRIYHLKLLDPKTKIRLFVACKKMATT